MKTIKFNNNIIILNNFNTPKVILTKEQITSVRGCGIPLRIIQCRKIWDATTRWLWFDDIIIYDSCQIALTELERLLDISVRVATQTGGKAPNYPKLIMSLTDIKEL